MSSVYRSSWEKEAREEIKELCQKDGWTQKEAERYAYLKKELGEN